MCFGGGSSSPTVQQNKPAYTVAQMGDNFDLSTQADQGGTTKTAAPKSSGASASDASKGATSQSAINMR